MTVPSPKSTLLRRLVLAIAAVVAVALVASFLVVYRWAHDPAREVAIAAIAAASKRPGARSVKDLGCDLALVQNDNDLQAIAESQGRKLGDRIPSGLLVSCLLHAKTQREPTCPDIARTYAAAVKDPAKRFFVQVVRQSGSGPTKQCEGIFGPDGELLEQATFR